MNPTIKLIQLIAPYQAYYDMTFEQAVQAMRKDLQDHQDLLKLVGIEAHHDH